ncbi:MAG: asparagine synthase (glutamine-hydrolyzing) [Vicinamibacterales bacterium]
MCGIAGILTLEPGRADWGPGLPAMQDALRHRGPDDAALWQSSSGAAAFAHTRLSVLDLSPAGRQPMSAADGRCTLVLNGEIYNAAELRRTLEQQGHAFQTRTDAEVVLHAYQAYGDDCVTLLRGMFAFALWDERDQTCLLARDRFGIKPFYYYVNEGQLIFASEVRALLASGCVPRVLEPRAVYQYFRTGSVPEPLTLLRDVRVLEAGHVGRWHAGRFEPRPYWTLAFPVDPALDPDPAGRTRAALLDSVTHHFVSDVPVGIFLSGGVDSTALVALARAAGRAEVRTFTMSLPGTANDEGPAARRVAAHFGTHHEAFAVDAAAGKRLFARYLSAIDQPSIDGLNTFAVAGFASERGLKVALSGIGADEVFGGYRSFADVPRLARWDRRLSRLGPARGALGRALGGIGTAPRLRRIGDMLGHAPGLSAAYTTFRGVFTRADASALARHFAHATHGESGDDEGDDLPPVDPTPMDAVSRLELTRYVRNQLLRDGDVMSMAWGLELRTPYLDAGVLDTVSRIPAATRLRPGKRLLLDAVGEVPSWVASQPKRCFQFPFEQWLEAEWREIFAGVGRNCPVKAVTWYQKWSIFMLQHWIEQAIPGGDPLGAGRQGLNG